MVEPEYPVKKRTRNLGKWLLLFSPSFFILAAVAYPFLALVTGNFTLNAVRQIGSGSAEWQLTVHAIKNSLAQGGVSAITSFALGFPLGLFLGRFDFRFRRIVNSLVIIPFFLPSIIVVFAFITGFGSQSMLFRAIPAVSWLSSGFPGIIAINTFFNAPLVALFTMIAAEQGDPGFEEAAMTLGANGLRRFDTVWGRETLLAAAGGTLLAFVYSFTGFAAPLIIGGPGYFTMDAWIYYTVRRLLDMQTAVVLAVMEALILVVPALLFILFNSAHRRVTGMQLRSISSRSHGKYHFYAGIAYVIIWLGVELYLLSSVFVASFVSPGGSSWQLTNYIQLFSRRVTNAVGISTTAAIVNTVFYGVSTSLLVVVLGMMWIIGKRRLYFRGGMASEPMQYLPLIVPSIMMAFSVLVVFGTITPVDLLWILIIVAQSAVAIPVVLRLIDAGFSSISKTYSEVALTLKGSPFFEVELPLARSTFASALMFGFAISLGEFSATNFLATTNYYPLTVEMYRLESVRLAGAAFSAAAILLLVSLISFYVIQRLGERFVGFR